MSFKMSPSFSFCDEDDDDESLYSLSSCSSCSSCCSFSSSVGSLSVDDESLSVDDESVSNTVSYSSPSVHRNVFSRILVNAKAAKAAKVANANVSLRNHKMKMISRVLRAFRR